TPAERPERRSLGVCPELVERARGSGDVPPNSSSFSPRPPPRRAPRTWQRGWWRHSREPRHLVLHVRLVGPRAVPGDPCVDLRVESLQQLVAAGDPRLHVRPAGRREPVPFLHAGVPAPDLVQVLLDLVGFRKGVVLPEVLELNLLDELGLALLHDLRV